MYSAETQESKPAYGDLNDDGNIGILDMILFKSYLNDKETKINLSAADLDDDIIYRMAIL